MSQFFFVPVCADVGPRQVPVRIVGFNLSRLYVLGKHHVNESCVRSRSGCSETLTLISRQHIVAFRLKNTGMVFHDMS